MTVEEIEARIDGIKAAAARRANEAAHTDEDELWRDVLRAIAGGADNPQELAEAALKSWDFWYDRWYA